ncbi:hypothetical protein POTOM_034614 [Populus tomentosa]|uniref:Thioredoxin domain-containing protein n=1 Tax=Populus tomentosa TaxID=118781 RepID=A0A8X7Z1J5_POPTO|nr:hypothetical protein POTOM_034614 [Populus tomentosa]
MASNATSLCSPPLTSSRAAVLHQFQQLNPNRLSFPINLNTAKRATNLTVQHVPLPLKVLCGRGNRGSNIFVPSPMGVGSSGKQLVLLKRGLGFESSSTSVTQDSWENSILKSDIPVLVEFYASWCGPCRMVHRVIDEIAAEYDGKLKCFVLNTDNDLQIAENYEIKAVPVVLLFKNGEKRESVVGTMPKEFYIAAVERVMQS